MAESLSSDYAQSNLGVDEAACTLAVLGMGGCAFQLQGTFTGTVTFEGTVDNGTWAALVAVPIGTTTPATTATSSGIFLASCVGLAQVRARMSTYSEGSVRVTIRAVLSAPALPILPPSE